MSQRTPERMRDVHGAYGAQGPHGAEAASARAPQRESRRAFLKTGLAMAGSLVLPLAFSDYVEAAADGTRFREINDWVRVDPDGRTIIGLSQAEVGQGVYTGLPQLLADEMDADWRRVSVEFVTGRDAYRIAAANEHPQQFVGASMSVTMFQQRLRIAGAQAREAFLAAGARRLGVRPTQCATKSGRVIHLQTGRSLGYGELLADAAQLPLDPQPRLKAQSARTLIGQPLHKLDAPAKVNGSAVFGIDVKVPGLLAGAVKMAPTLNGKPVAVRNRDTVRALPGVVEVVPAKDAVIVVANTWWQAKQACDALDVQWEDSGPPADSAAILAQRKAALMAEHAVAATRIGDAPAQFEAAAQSRTGSPGTHDAPAGAKVIEADYHTPYIVHATMEPVNATVHVREHEIEVWGPIQGQDKVRWTLGAIFKLPPEKVIVNTTFLGGSFGRKYVPDFVIHAAVASKAVGRPVKVVRSREDDIRHGFYRPGVSARMRAVLGADGYPSAMHLRVVGQSLYWSIKRDYFEKAGGWDETMLDGLYDLGYAVPNLLVDSVSVDQPIPVSFMRSVGSTSSIFFLESFVNELAHAARIDPLEYRRTLLRDDPLALRVLERTAARANWARRPAPGLYRGLAYCLYTGRGGAFTTYVAIVAELRMVDGKAKLERVVCGIDCGQAINPMLIREMVEGGIGFALTNTFKSEITFKDGAVVQENFSDYPLLTLSQMPKIEVEIVESDRTPQGCGEVVLPPVAPAVAAALFEASGTRLRTMPLEQALA
nr:molybdopterin cofactor-binding domain-containing protein [Paraburkholderia pallida]